MRKTVALLLVVAILAIWAAPVFAHGDEAIGPVGASTLIRQAIAFLAGIQDSTTAQMKIQAALKADGIRELNQAKINDALTAIKKSDTDMAIKLLAESLGQDPQTSSVVPLRPGYTSSALNTGLLALAIIFIVLGGVIVFRVKASAKSIVHQTSTTNL